MTSGGVFWITHQVGDDKEGWIPACAGDCYFWIPDQVGYDEKEYGEVAAFFSSSG